MLIERELIKLESLSKIENLVFQGGGVRGIAYIGALEELCNKSSQSKVNLTQIKRVGGASAGAITAFFIGIGKPLDDLKKFLNKDFKEFLDDELCPNAKVTYKYAVLKTIDILNSELFYEESRNTFKVDTMDFFVVYVARILSRLGIQWATGQSKASIANEIKRNENARRIFEAIYDFFKIQLDKLKLWFFEKIEDLIDFVVEKLIQFGRGKIGKIETSMMGMFPSSNPKRDLDNYFNAFYETMLKIVVENGIFAGEELLAVFQQEIIDVSSDKDITFREFHQKKSEFKRKGFFPKDLYIVALNLSTGITTIFSHTHTPDVIIVDAVRASISIPFFFVPPEVRCRVNGNIQPYGLVINDQQNDEREYIPVFTDGGVLDNFPIWLFDSNKYTSPSSFYRKNLPIYNQSTLGFRLIDEENKRLFELGHLRRCQVEAGDSLFRYTSALIKSVVNKQDSDHYHGGDRIRTVYIDTQKVGTVEFNLTLQKKQLLINSGKEAVTSFFERLRKHELKIYEYSVRRSLHYALLNGLITGSISFSAGTALGSFHGNSLETGGSFGILSGITTIPASFFSSILTNTKFFGNKNTQQERNKRITKRATVTGIFSCTFIFGFFIGIKNEDLLAIAAIALFGGGVAVTGSFLTDVVLKPRLAR